MSVFGLLKTIAFAYLMRTHTPLRQFQTLLSGCVVAIVILGMLGVIGSTYKALGVVVSIAILTCARCIPTIVLVSESQPTTWLSFSWASGSVFPCPRPERNVCFRELGTNGLVFLAVWDTDIGLRTPGDVVTTAIEDSVQGSVRM